MGKLFTLNQVAEYHKRTKSAISSKVRKQKIGKRISPHVILLTEKEMKSMRFREPNKEKRNASE